MNTDALKGLALKQLYGYLDKDPETNIPKVLDLLEKYGDGIRGELSTIRGALADPDNNWSRLVKSVWTDVNAAQRRTAVETFVINGSLLGTPKATASQEKYGCNVPWVLVIDPTSACNLHCTGCWAAEYGNRLNLTFDELDSIVSQGKELGTYVYMVAGGEPLMRKTDLLRLCEKHSDCAFIPYTNGTLIDDAFADEILRVRNLFPTISIEGFEETTDARRGAGTYRRILAAMERLRARKLLFGVSCCYTSKNVETVVSEAFIDFLIAQGAKFAWFFNYVPVGTAADTSLLTTAEQRKMVFERIRAFRDTKPLFTIDNGSDAEYVGGCVAGGRGYAHINANGDVEPCAFVHYADSNIRQKTLLQAYQSPLFMSFRKAQPFNGNMMRPCPVMDNPHCLTKLVESVDAPSTDMMGPEPARDYCAKCEAVAAAWKPVADEIWNSLPNRHGVRLTGKMARKS